MLRKFVSRCLLAAAAAFPAVASAEPQEEGAPQEVRESRVIVAQDGAAAGAGEVRVFAFAKDGDEAKEARVAVAGGEYWIGVQLEPLPELLTSQLKLERGMVVAHVFDDSPAAKAEVQANDIILRAADKDVKGPDDLVAAVNDSKDKELTIVLLRGGSERTFKLTPAKRPADTVELAISPDEKHADVIAKLEALGKAGPGGDVRLFAVRPGGVFAMARGAKFPANLEVVIEKRGDKPATIRVKRSGEGEEKSWEVTEDKLGELPEDIRVHVQQLLSGHGHGSPQALAIRVEDLHKHAAEAQAKAAEAQRKVERTLQSYKLKVEPKPGVPGVPGVPGAPGVPGVRSLPAAGARVVMPFAGGQELESIKGKLDAILKKLDEDSAVQRLEKEVKSLRKEVEELRQGKK